MTVQCEECGRRSTLTRYSLISSVVLRECGKDNTVRLREDLVVWVLEDEESVILTARSLRVHATRTLGGAADATEDVLP